jgi:hypothetical protein
MSTDTNATQGEATELKPNAPVWIKDANGAEGRGEAIFNKFNGDTTQVQVKIKGYGFKWLPASDLLGPREVAKVGVASTKKADAEKPAGEAKAAKAPKEPKVDDAATQAEKEAAEKRREERKAEKAKKREEEKAAREKRKADKKAERDAKKGEGGTKVKKSRGNGIRLSNVVLDLLQAEIPVASTQEGDQSMSIPIISEKVGKREEDVQKAVNVLVEKKLVTVTKVDVPEDGETRAFSYDDVALTEEGRKFEKTTSTRSKSEGGEKGDPMQKRIADLVRKLYTNDEIIAELSTPAEGDKPAYNLARSFVSTVRSRMKDPELYKFNYATADDFERDYLAERKERDRTQPKPEPGVPEVGVVGDVENADIAVPLSQDNNPAETVAPEQLIRDAQAGQLAADPTTTEPVAGEPTDLEHGTATWGEGQ